MATSRHTPTKPEAVIREVPCRTLLNVPRLPLSEDGWVYDPDGDWDSQLPSSDQHGGLTYVEIDEFLATS